MSKNTDFSRSMNLPVEHTLFLQRTIGNQAVQRLLKAGILAPQYSAGKQEVGRLLQSHRAQSSASDVKTLVKSEQRIQHASTHLSQAYFRGDHDLVHTAVRAGKGEGSPLSAEEVQKASRQFGGDMSGVRLHTDSFADRTAHEIGAAAFTLGQDIFVRHDALPLKTNLLWHELFHVTQTLAGQLGHDEATLEAQAKSSHPNQHSGKSAFNAAIHQHQSASISTAQPSRLLCSPAAKASHVVIILPNKLVIYGDKGEVTASITLLPEISMSPGTSYSIRRHPQSTMNFQVMEATKEVEAFQYWVERKQVKLFKDYLASMTEPIPLEVKEAGAAIGTEKGAEPEASTTEAPAPPETKGIVVQVADINQIEQLKKKGLIPVETADQIQAKLEKNEILTYEEAITLVEAFNRVIVGSEEKEWKEARESWLKWAKFFEQNKDKISGRGKTSDKGITVEEVKEILKKYKEYVGIEKTTAKTTKEAIYDPELRKSWNTLSDWEKNLWKEYLDKYGNTADVTDPSTKDLRVTKAVRFSMALRMSPQFMPAGASEAAEQLFNDPIFLWGTMAGITAYLALWLVPEPVFTKAAAVLTTIGLMSLVAFSVSEIINLASAWMTLSDESAKATTLEELEKAAEKFGKSLGGSGLRILVALATVVAGKLLPSPKPLPPPSGGGGGMAAAGAGGPNVVVSRPVTVPIVKVDPVTGTLVVVGGPLVGITAAAVSAGGKGGGKTPTPAKKPIEKVLEWEKSGKIKGDLSRLKKDLLSTDKATRLGAEAEVTELQQEIMAGRTPTVRGATPGPDQPTYEVKARTEPFSSQKNAENFFADRIKAANSQFRGDNATGRVVINLGEEKTIQGKPITAETARSMVAKALSKGGRGTNITEVVVKKGNGEIIYKGKGD